MLKFMLITVVTICLSGGTVFSEQTGEPIKLKGPRQINTSGLENTGKSSLLVRSFGDNSSEADHTAPPKSKIDGDVLTTEKYPGHSNTTYQTRPPLAFKMSADFGGMGLSGLVNRTENVAKKPLVDRKRMGSLLMSDSFLRGLGQLAYAPPVQLEKRQAPQTPKWKRLEIEVSHSSHVFTLFSENSDGSRQTLYECKIGLGAPEFPTPVGVYYVTHIYDQDPWWIPPANRAWAAGDSPSQRVYGGTMAPLLKKKMMNVRKKDRDREKAQEDFVENQVKLEDYGYRFHGTNQPRSIGRNQSHGCVRMLSDDAKKVSYLIKEHVGALDRRESENGPFVVLNAPVKLNLTK